MRTPDGKTVEVIDLDFDVESERETKIKLEDGSVLSIRTAVMKVSRLKDLHDPVTGDPIYFVQTQPIIRVRPDPRLMRKL
jgi:hypothetical protein